MHFCLLRCFHCIIHIIYIRMSIVKATTIFSKEKLLLLLLAVFFSFSLFLRIQCFIRCCFFFLLQVIARRYRRRPWYIFSDVKFNSFAPILCIMSWCIAKRQTFHFFQRRVKKGRSEYCNKCQLANGKWLGLVFYFIFRISASSFFSFFFFGDILFHSHFLFVVCCLSRIFHQFFSSHSIIVDVKFELTQCRDVQCSGSEPFYSYSMSGSCQWRMMLIR